MKFLFVALLALSAYVYAAEAISCYVCGSPDTDKSGTRRKDADNCLPENVPVRSNDKSGKSGSKSKKSGSKSGSKSVQRTDTEDNCDYCVLVTKQVYAGTSDEYSVYDRYCVKSASSTVAVLAFFGATCKKPDSNDNQAAVVTTPISGTTITAECCTDDLCNSATYQLVTIISTLLPILVAVFWH